MQIPKNSPFLMAPLPLDTKPMPAAAEPKKDPAPPAPAKEPLPTPHKEPLPPAVQNLMRRLKALGDKVRNMAATAVDSAVQTGLTVADKVQSALVTAAVRLRG